MSHIRYFIFSVKRSMHSPIEIDFMNSKIKQTWDFHRSEQLPQIQSTLNNSIQNKITYHGNSIINTSEAKTFTLY